MTEILEVLVSGRLGGVPGGESRFRLLAIIREAAAGEEKGESSQVGPWEGGQDGQAWELNGEGVARVPLRLY